MSVSLNIIRVRADIASIADVGEDAFEAFGAPAELASRVARELPGCAIERHVTKNPFTGERGGESWVGVYVDADTGAKYEVDCVCGEDGAVTVVVVRPPAGNDARMRAALRRAVGAVARAVGGTAFTDDGERFE